MYVPFHDGVISQFEGYGRLEELDWEGYRSRYGDVQRLDRILEAEGLSPNRYKLSKQADVLMLFYLLSADELRELFERLGYALTPETMAATFDYYEARSTHGSTLSAVVHSWVLARSQRERALQFFEQALISDVADVQGGTTREGIHLAAMAGTVDLLQRCFSGLEVRGEQLTLNPHWPASLGTLTFSIQYRDVPLTLQISADEVEVAAGPGLKRPITVSCHDEVAVISGGGSAVFRL